MVPVCTFNQQAILNKVPCGTEALTKRSWSMTPTHVSVFHATYSELFKNTLQYISWLNTWKVCVAVQEAANKLKVTLILFAANTN